MKYLPKTLKNKNGSLSLGRFFITVLLLFSIGRYWSLLIDIPPNLAVIIITLLGYELGKKGRDAYVDIKKPTTTVDTEP
jgi:hypothetical protein